MTGHTPIRVLSIEDDARDAVHLQRILRDALTTSGVEFRHITNGRDALSTIRRFHPDVVLLDYMMPGMDGMEVLQAIQTHEPLVPVVMVTGRGGESVAVDAMHLGAVDYLPKKGLSGATVVRALFRAMAIKRYETNRARADELAARVEAEAMATMNAAARPLIVVDAKGGIRRINDDACSLLGWRRPEVTGGDFHALVHRIQPPNVYHDPYACPLAAALASPRPGRMDDAHLCHASGSFVPVHLTLEPLPTNRGGGFVIAFDVGSATSGTRGAWVRDAERIKADQERTDMLNVIGHLVQTPMTPILLKLKVLQQEQDRLSERQQKALEVMERNLRRLQGVFDTTRAVTELRRGTHRLRPVEVELGEEIRRVLQKEQAFLEERFVQVHVDSERLSVDADPDALRKVLRRLLHTSILRSEPDGLIRATIRRDGDWAEIAVEDAGPALTAGEIRGLLDPFGFLMGDTSTGEQAEHALWFYVGRILVEAHGGTLNIENLGAMTRFEVRWPVHGVRSDEPLPGLLPRTGAVDDLPESSTAQPTARQAPGQTRAPGTPSAGREAADEDGQVTEEPADATASTPR